MCHTPDNQKQFDLLLHLTGDFMDLGYDQVLHISEGRIIIEDFNKKNASTITRYSEALANDSALRKLVEADEVLAGDFLARGHSQVLFVDRERTPSW
jgi:hypothetical protein